MESQQPVKKPRIGLIWWIILVALLAWNVWTLWPKAQPPISIPYSTFINQVQADQVASVQIVGNQINGVFTHPLPYQDLLPDQVAAQGPNASVNTETFIDFKTTFPDVIGDNTLIPLLNIHKVTVDVTPAPSPWLSLLLTNGLPILLMVGFLVLMGRNAARSQSSIFNFGRSKPRRYSLDKPEVTFNDVAGADEAKRELVEVVDFLRQPQKYFKIGARIPSGVLLVGAPGTGKTLLARAVAGEAGVPFFSITASEFVEMFVGVGASRVRTLFEQAKASAPAIIFIDELDAVGRRRGAGLGNINDEREQTLNQLLVEMDGFDTNHEIIVIAATNRPDVLDPALLRPGRFDREINVSLPDKQGREGILRIHTRKLTLSSNVDLGLLARTTTGLSGADLANLCNEAALNAARNNRESVTMADFEEAIDRILLGEVRPLLLDAHDRQVVAYHEAGHALVAWLTPNSDPVHKVTIIPRGRALGVTEQLPSEDHYNFSREYLLARISVMLGGRTAEEIALGDITTGAENDLAEATRLARRMITRWGMGSLGQIAFVANEEQPFLGYELTQGREYSEETASLIDRDIHNILEQRHELVRQLLEREHQKLDQLVQVLLKEETVEQDELGQILGPRALPAESESRIPIETAQPQPVHSAFTRSERPDITTP